MPWRGPDSCSEGIKLIVGTQVWRGRACATQPSNYTSALRRSPAPFLEGCWVVSSTMLSSMKARLWFLFLLIWTWPLGFLSNEVYLPVYTCHPSRSSPFSSAFSSLVTHVSKRSSRALRKETTELHVHVLNCRNVAAAQLICFRWNLSVWFRDFGADTVTDS